MTAKKIRDTLRSGKDAALDRHINNGLMGFRLSAVVAVAGLEGFQAVFTAIKLST